MQHQHQQLPSYHMNTTMRLRASRKARSGLFAIIATKSKSKTAINQQPKTSNTTKQQLSINNLPHQRQHEIKT
jgi:hypothetical protein